MNTILIILLFILLFKWITSSNRAATITQACTRISNQPTAGDSFKTGCSIIPGVPEKVIPLRPGSQMTTPVQKSQLCLLRCDARQVSALPVHVIFPVAPPPIAIQTPVVPALPLPAKTTVTATCTPAPAQVFNPLTRLLGGGGGSVSPIRTRQINYL